MNETSHKKLIYKSIFLPDLKNYTDLLNYKVKSTTDSTFNFLFNYELKSPPFDLVKLENRIKSYRLYSLNINCFIDKCDIISDLTSNADLIGISSERTIFYDEKKKEYILSKNNDMIEIKQGEDILMINKYFNRDFLTLDTKRIYLFYKKINKPKTIQFSCFQHFLSEEDKEELHSSTYQTQSEKHTNGMCISNRERIINFTRL